MSFEDATKQLYLAAIIGLAGLCVTYISDMSRNIQTMTVSVQELNARMGQVSATMSDHEQRLRVVEKLKNIKE